MEIPDFSNPRLDSEDSQYARLYKEVKRLVGLEAENAKLLLTEKLTLLLGRITLAAVCFVVSTAAFIFLSMSVADFLLRDLAPCWTYLIVGGFYVLIVIIVACFRRQLIVDPIARYISRVVLDPPTPVESELQNAATPKHPLPEQ